MNPTLRYAHLAPNVWAALEKEERKGWIRAGVQKPETVAEHTLELIEIGKEVALAHTFSNQESDDLLAMLEVHDWPEAILGDKVTLHGAETYEHERVQREEKHVREEAAMRSITASLGAEGERVLSLWLRFERSTDRVAGKAREIDKYQAIERACRYEREQGIAGLGDEFVRYSPPVTDEYLCARLTRVLARI